MIVNYDPKSFIVQATSISHAINSSKCAPVVEWYDTRLIILRSKVRILPLAPGERKKQKMLQINFLFTIIPTFLINKK